MLAQMCTPLRPSAAELVSEIANSPIILAEKISQLLLEELQPAACNVSVATQLYLRMLLLLRHFSSPQALSSRVMPILLCSRDGTDNPTTSQLHLPALYHSLPSKTLGTCKHFSSGACRENLPLCHRMKSNQNLFSGKEFKELGLKEQRPKSILLPTTWNFL